MLCLTFLCPKCQKPIVFEYADYSFRDWVNDSKDHFEILECSCGKKFKAVPWVAVVDEENKEPITFV